MNLSIFVQLIQSSTLPTIDCARLLNVFTEYSDHKSTLIIINVNKMLATIAFIKIQHKWVSIQHTGYIFSALKKLRFEITG